MRPWRSRRWAAAGVALLFLSGCVERDGPGVAVQKLATDIVFGVEPPGSTTPPNLVPGPVGAGEATTYLPFTPPPGSGPAAFGGGGDFSGPAGRARARLPRLTPLVPSKEPCPPAALTAFPAKEAGQTLEGRPAEGQYRWKRSGTQAVADLPGVTVPITGFEQRLVRNVVSISPTEFTFETVQPELGSDITTISTFKVKVGATSRTVTAPVEPPDSPSGLLPPPPVPGSVSVGDPERGISLLKLQRVDGAGNSNELTFSPAVLYLPLDIVPGEEFTSVGIDPRSGSVLQHQAKVTRRDRVDACGEIVDGWVVESKQTFTGPGPAAPPRTYTYIVAPQLGGLIISEEISVSTPQASTDVVLSIGQVNPSPPPAESQETPK